MPCSISTNVDGMIATVGDQSGFTIECFIITDQSSFNFLKLKLHDEFVFFGGTRIFIKGILFFVDFLKVFRRHHLFIVEINFCYNT